MPIAAHERPIKGATDVWLTPRHVLDLLGPFDLDPCGATDPPWPTAAHAYTESDDGLSRPWFGFVWCNPPYSQARQWLSRLALHGNGIGFIFARTETVGFHAEVWNKADAVAFPQGRYKFHLPDGSPSANSAGAPSCFVAYGPDAVQRLRRIPNAAVVSGWRNSPWPVPVVDSAH